MGKGRRTRSCKLEGICSKGTIARLVEQHCIGIIEVQKRTNNMLNVQKGFRPFRAHMALTELTE